MFSFEAPGTTPEVPVIYPPRPNHLRVAALAALIALGCTTREVIPVELGSAPLDYVFLVTLDAAGAPVRVTDVAGIVDGRFKFRDAVIPELHDGELSIAAAGFTREVLAAAFPAFAIAREAELEARVQRAPAMPILRPDRTISETLLDTALPEGVLYFRRLSNGALERFEVPPPELIGGLSLAVPIDHQTCGKPNEPALDAFARTETPLEVFPDQSQQNVNILRAIRLDRDRALVMTSFALLELRRGRDFEPRLTGPGQVGNWLPIAEFLPDGHEIIRTLNDIALDPQPRADGARILTMVNLESPSAGLFPTRIWEVLIREQGIELVGSATVPFDLRAIHVSRDGTRALTGMFGDVYLLPRGAPLDAIQALPKLDTPPDLLAGQTRIYWTGIDAWPLLAGGKDRVHVFDAGAERWETTVIDQARLRAGVVIDFNEKNLALDALAAFPDENELWVGGTAGALFRRIGGGEWTRIDLVPPPDYAPCARPVRPYPDMLLSDRIDDMVEDGAHLYFTIRGCAAIVELRRSDLCMRLVTVEGQQAGASLLHDLQAIDKTGDRLLVAGEKGFVYERPPP